MKMNPERFSWLMLAALLSLAVGWPLQAEEMVTVPKSRLVELEQKEKELGLLKAELGRARGEQEKLKREKESADVRRVQAEAKAAQAQAAAAAVEPFIAHESPALASLPPLKKGDVVDALDLMNHYRADAAGAEGRYGKHRLRVRGVVTAFDKPLFVSHYFILLRTTERLWRIKCAVEPPAEFKATFVGQQGETLVGVTSSGARLTLARVGQTVEIEAASRGLKEQTLSLGGGSLVATE